MGENISRRKFHNLLEQYCEQGIVSFSFQHFNGGGWSKLYWYNGNPVLCEYVLPFNVCWFRKIRYSVEI